MFQIAKLLFYVLREMVFDNAEESNFKSAKFNARKFFILVAMVVSIMMNLWLMYRFVHVAQEFRMKEQQLAACFASDAKSTEPAEEKASVQTHQIGASCAVNP